MGPLSIRLDFARQNPYAEHDISNHKGEKTVTVDAFRALLSNTDLFVYERSVDENDGTVAALVRHLGKHVRILTAGTDV